MRTKKLFLLCCAVILSSSLFLAGCGDDKGTGGGYGEIIKLSVRQSHETVVFDSVTVVELAVTANSEHWDYKCEQTWLTFDRIEDNLYATVTPNLLKRPRTAVIVFTEPDSEDFTVTLEQEGGASKAYSFDFEGLPVKGISSNGRYIVGGMMAALSANTGFFWDTWSDDGPILFEDNIQACTYLNSVSDDGIAVGSYYGLPGIYDHNTGEFTYLDLRAANISPSEGNAGYVGEARSITPDGRSIVGHVDAGAGRVNGWNTQAVVWKGSSYTSQLLEMPEKDHFGADVWQGYMAMGQSEDGSVIFGFQKDDNGDWQGVLWNPRYEFFGEDRMVWGKDEYGFWQLVVYTPWGISPDGRYVTGAWEQAKDLENPDEHYQRGIKCGFLYDTRTGDFTVIENGNTGTAVTNEGVILMGNNVYSAGKVQSTADYFLSSYGVENGGMDLAVAVSADGNYYVGNMVMDAANGIYNIKYVRIIE